MSEVSNPSHEVELPHEPLSDDQLGNLLAADGNHEGKALLVEALAARGSDGYLSPSGLHGLFTGLPGAEDVYTGTLNNQVAWCKQSLAPNGLVELEAGSISNFRITPKGREVGVELADAALNFGDRHDVPLVYLFASTKSANPLRAPLTRVKIMRAILSASGPIGYKDLLQVTGVANETIIRRHLSALGKAGLIGYDARDGGVAASYSLVQATFRPSRETAQVWKGVTLDYLRSHKSATLDELMDHCRQTLPSELVDDLKDSDIRKKVITTLSHPINAGYVARSDGQQPAGQLKVTLSPEQQTMWIELLDLLEEFKHQAGRSGRQLAEQPGNFVSDPAKVHRALLRMAASSPHMNPEPDCDVTSLVRSVLTRSQAPMSVREIIDVMANDGQRRTVSDLAVREVIRRCLGTGELIAKSGRVGRFSLRQAITSTDLAQ